ncbi:MAG: methionine gamma-lyase family protein [Defluviitaleaceae bacterium]|nr:methionine gamma-lyase family protein [Defluviitaleaceae bacterium]
MSKFNFLRDNYNINPKLLEISEIAEKELYEQFVEIEKIAEYNQLKVLKAMQDNRLSDVHFAGSTGYGYNDLGRDTLEEIYASAFGAEAALCRPQIISGTHALSLALFGNLKHGDELLYITGTPYDTLKGVIGIRETRNSLMDNGIIYSEVSLLEDGSFDYENIKNAINGRTKVIGIQRSKGYSLRHSLTIDEISDIIKFVKNIDDKLCIMVDNCYGEFTDYLEPSELGADMTVGSLIKNPGGGLAPVGGYIVGTEECVENAAAKLSSPGIGKEAGPSLGITQSFTQGLFLAPNVTAASMKMALFTAVLFEKLGFSVTPKPCEKRGDIVQAILLKNAENIISFCKGVQMAAPVDSFVSPEPWDMPGYDCQVIMAAGAFIQGASIEFSADAPIREPFAVYLQGGLTYHHGKNGVLIAVQNMINDGLISI